MKIIPEIDAERSIIKIRELRIDGDTNNEVVDALIDIMDLSVVRDLVAKFLYTIFLTI